MLVGLQEVVHHFPTQIKIRYQVLGANTFTDVTTSEYGIPNSPLTIDDKTIMFGCQLRLCALNRSNGSVDLISSASVQSGSSSSWITLNKIRYAVAGVSGKLTLLKP